jgi:glutamate--cysteine ligase
MGELRHRLERGARPAAQHRVGLEHEKVSVLADGSAPTYEGAIAPLLERLAEGAGWRRVMEGDHVIALERGTASVSLEPGGQFEFSDEPRATARACAEVLDAHLAELTGPAAALGIQWLACGFRPLGTLDEVPWMPKGRYAVMREYLPRRGRLGHEMMKRTTTVQANLDFADEADCAEKMRVGMGITSLVTALWANSPLVDGRPAGYQSYRAACWLEMDDDRCGLLPFVFEAGLETQLFRRYAEWALDVPMFFVHRRGQYLPAGGMTFRRFLAEGFHGERATMADWELHLSTLFPEVRLRPYIEMRAADAGTRGMVKALPALYRGLLYDGEARRAAWELVAGWSFAERQALRRDVPRRGLAAEVRGQRIHDRCRALVEIARAGLARLGDDTTLLDPVLEVAETGRTYADRMLAAYQAAGGDVAAFIAAIRL